MSFRTIEWKEDHVVLLDQRRLPREQVYVECWNFDAVVEAIRNMTVRGAPAIGVVAALGLALGARQIRAREMEGFLRRFKGLCKTMGGARPTAINLFWAIGRMERILHSPRPEGIDEAVRRLEDEALAILREDVETNRLIGQVGRVVIKDGDTVLTHCNAGALATAGYGTALGVIRAAVAEGKRVRVFVDETRPRLQGARLTAWELSHDGIPVTLITDSMAGCVMQKGLIDLVLVGADRIAGNGDVANKIGTYSLATLAHVHGIPFYVAAPVSTIDVNLPEGSQIPIEERAPEEITEIFHQPIAPSGVEVFNPAFDVTPCRYVDGIITETDILREPFERTIRALMSRVS
ncbi:MAG: S-methyl-5-thioribose-1-phosphate isomerase [Deltaproteobacteria bacterium]|nr:S-methyl-5-thioribose-1-phosphate isomerase [Deltaproteobacteria bacterium]MBW2121071.1 S-methyl-5-thioribose-1-phosphate isomerase [Deltaproteobacteria bacterium]